MANKVKMTAATLGDTAVNQLIKATGSSIYIISSIIIANRTVGTDTTVDLLFNDDSQAASFYLINDEPFPAKLSKEILSRPIILESEDSLSIQVADANTIDILISYLNRDRN